MFKRPVHLQNPEQTYSLDGSPNPRVLKPDFFAQFRNNLFENSEQKQRLQLAYEKQRECESRLFQIELDCSIPGVSPKHSRPRKKRIIYGSDVEDAVAGPIQPFNTVAPEQNPNLENGVISDDEFIPDTEGSSSPESDHDSLMQRIRLPFINDDDVEDEDLYEPRREKNTNSRRRQKRKKVREKFEAPEPSDWVTISDRTYSPYLPQVYNLFFTAVF